MSTILKALRRLEEDRTPASAKDRAASASTGGGSTRPPAIDPGAADELRDRILAEEAAAWVNEPRHASPSRRESILEFVANHRDTLATATVLVLAVGLIWFSLSGEATRPTSPPPDQANVVTPGIVREPAAPRPMTPVASARREDPTPSAQAESRSRADSDTNESANRQAASAAAPALAVGAGAAGAAVAVAASEGSSGSATNSARSISTATRTAPPAPTAPTAPAAPTTPAMPATPPPTTQSAAAAPSSRPSTAPAAQATGSDETLAPVRVAGNVPVGAVTPTRSAAAADSASQRSAASQIETSDKVAVHEPMDPSPYSEPMRPRPSSTETAPTPVSSRAAKPPSEAGNFRVATGASAQPEAPRSRPASPSPSRQVERIDRRGLPDIRVLRTSWHPRSENRSARIRLEDSQKILNLQEGDAVGALVVKEISPSSVLFAAGEIEIRRRVGQAGGG